MILLFKEVYKLGRIAMLLFLSLPVLSQDKDNRYPPTSQPDRVNLTVTADPSTSMAVTWRTTTDIGTAYAEIQVANANPTSIKDAKRITARTETSAVESGKYKELVWKGVTANYHSVIFEGLKPNTLYSYRVGAGDYWSEWFQFRTTGSNGQKLSFVYLGDAQTDLYSMWSKVIRQAYTQMPETRLVLHAGDLVNRDNHDEEWGEWFAAGSFIFGMVPNMPSPGNHDYGRDENIHKLSPFWRPQFTLPENGPEGLKETCYFTDVQGVRFISLDAYMAEESDEFLGKQQRWVDSVLHNNPNKWTVVLFHHPIYSPKSSRDNKRMRETFKPLFDKYKVDLVLQGHDHTYARGMAKIPMQQKGSTSGTMYVVSVSGPKMTDSGVEKKYWMDRSAVYTQLFHVATVENGKLQFRTYTSTGELFDAFDLVKQKGKINKLIEMMPAK
ncbi:metallophosphoesterase family protein [Chitinophaga sp. MM2321]|uniref:metallophosphoesterase family protein n=1 Tax=Chitinophaga sp. MM2321 TaxID=3137178 RepID=UPI0032D5A2F3